MNWLFYGVLIFVIGLCAYGYHKGLIRMLYSIGTFILSIVIMIVASPIVADVLMKNEDLMSKLQQPVQQLVQEKLDEGLNIDQILEENCHLPNSVVETIQEFVQEDAVTTQTNAVAQSVGICFAEYVCKIMAYIIVFVGVQIALFVVGRILNIVEKLPVINTMNRLGGVALGLVEAFGLIWVFFILVDACRTFEWGAKALELIMTNPFLCSLYENNLFLMFL